ncbi:MAG: carbohydrate kinase family protein [Clostridia bacterium]|nr:carbohydrate kinase family protein [Clostridia bacterium]
MKVSVIGASNIDISGRSAARFAAGDSNPGTVTRSLGGVGRNISHNLRLLGEDVVFFTAIGGDEYAEAIAGDCAALGIDLSHALYRPELRSSVYLCINDEKGELVAGIADMELCEAITTAYLKRELDRVNDADAIVIDTNLSEEALGYMLTNAVRPVFVDCVSGKKTEKLKRALELHPGRIFALKANRTEAGVLVGGEVRGEADAMKAAAELCEYCADRVFITLGAGGVCCADKSGAFTLPAPKVNVVNSSGAGDSFVAALVHAYGAGADLRASAECGLKAAKLALESPSAVSNRMSAAELSIKNKRRFL